MTAKDEKTIAELQQQKAELQQELDLSNAKFTESYGDVESKSIRDRRPHGPSQITNLVKMQQVRAKNLMGDFRAFGIRDKDHFKVYPGHELFEPAIHKMDGDVGGISETADYREPQPIVVAGNQNAQPIVMQPIGGEQKKGVSTTLLIAVVVILGILVMSNVVYHIDVARIDAQVLPLETYLGNHTVNVAVNGSSTTNSYYVTGTEAQQAALAISTYQDQQAKESSYNNIITAACLIAFVGVVAGPAILAFLQKKGEEGKAVTKSSRRREIVEALLQMHRESRATIAYFSAHQEQLSPKARIEWAKAPWASVRREYELRGRPLDAEPLLSELLELGLNDCDMKIAFLVKGLVSIEASGNVMPQGK